jgi:hypothetical protein
MSASAIQFRGIEVVITAYKANKVAPWAIHNGKQILFSSDGVEGDDIDEGSAQLRAVLNMMAKGGTEAKYMLAVYKLKEGQEVDSGTNYYRSFNFTLYGIDEMSPYMQRTSNMYTQEFSERMDRLEALVTKLAEDEDEEEDRPKGIMGALNGMMDNPQIQQAIAGFVLSKLGMMPAALPALGKVGGLEKPAADPQASILSPEQAEKAQRAIVQLCALDSKLGDNLLKIANIAKTEPNKYQMFAAML